MLGSSPHTNTPYMIQYGLMKSQKQVIGFVWVQKTHTYSSPTIILYKERSIGRYYFNTESRDVFIQPPLTDKPWLNDTIVHFARIYSRDHKGNRIILMSVSRQHTYYYLVWTYFLYANSKFLKIKNIKCRI